MATTQQDRTIIASWVPTDLADELKRHAEDEDRSVSAVVRRALQENFADVGEGAAPRSSRRRADARKES
jgi:hypothetical protein